MSHEILNELEGEIRKYGFTSIATGQRLLAEVRRLNEVVDRIIAQDRMRGYPTGGEWITLVSAAKAKA
jgi:hypothetical protein